MAEARGKSYRPSWSGVAFIVEAMLLLVFLIGSLALLTSLFASSVQRGNESRELTAAVALASDTAERFCADPASIEERFAKDGLTVVCDVSDEARAGGVYYKADITVYGKDATPVYTITTAVYEGGAA